MSSTQAEFEVPRIKCDGCASTIRQAVGPLVEAVEVDVAARRVRVTLLPGGADEATVRAALEQAGYPADQS